MNSSDIVERLRAYGGDDERDYRHAAASHIEAQEKLLHDMILNVGDYLQKLGTMQAAMKDGLNVQGAISGFVAAEEVLMDTMERAAALSQKDTP